MNRILCSVSALLLAMTASYAQQAFDPTNARPGEDVEYCHQHTIMEHLRINNPQEYAAMMQDRDQLNREAKLYSNSKDDETVYTIPVVFHVLHTNGAENISYEQILDAVNILNRDYRRLNASADQVQAPFIGMPTDAKIEFKLATIAPNGQCFNGVTRTVSTLTNVTLSSQGTQQLNAAFNGNDVYQGQWPSNKYLNIIVAKTIGGAAGYTRYPNNQGTASNSIWILSNYVGSIGTGNASTSTALTHEVGHWLNLSHTWGDNNNPGNAASCSSDDHVMDTPLCIGVQQCNLTSNTCNDANSSMSSWTYDVVDNVENYMDYSYCSKMYTPGQVDRMRAAIVSSVGGRNNIWSQANLIEVGAIDNPPLCQAAFKAERTVICAGESVDFIDQSYSEADEWNWTFQGGTPSTSNEQNPTVVFNTPGSYTVTLNAKQNGLEKSTSKVGFITVLEPGTALPFSEGFETYNNISQAQLKWFVYNPGANATFEITTSAAHSGSKSLKLANYGLEGTQLDEIASNSIDLSPYTLDSNVTLTYRYAYKKRVANNNEYLKVFFSENCGTSWDMRSSTNSFQMAGNAAQTTAYTPVAADWKTIHIPFNAEYFNKYFTSNFRFKFRFEGNGGNNIYIDDINIYTSSQANNVGINDVEAFNGVTLYPNPSDDQATVVFYLNDAQTINLKIMDLTGKEIKASTIKAQVGENEIHLNNSDLAAGLYLIQLSTPTSAKTLQMVKK